MDETSENSRRAIWTALLRVLRPALPAVIGAAALTFLFAAVMPMSWVAGISWNLYLDRLSDFFMPPIGNAGRLALALGMAAVAAVLAGLVALLIAKPEAAGLTSLRRRVRPPADVTSDDDDGEAVLTRRRRVDLHPDDAPRPPIRAGRDLPAGGLGPLNGNRAEEAAVPDPWLREPDTDEADELVLADLAPEDAVAGEEPWLQPAEMTGPAIPDPADNSLGAMVARFEAGLARRRHAPDVAAATVAIPVPEGAGPRGEPEVDFALEAALGTLQRMTRQSVG
ncbi:hypothetical protein [Sphingopyxis sp.]|uniref:hypothetical protein n=1 Tax=Sphingopyxis sp. TaxID=1908224 RepID=UPI002EDA947E